jgi:hypothetical protein
MEDVSNVLLQPNIEDARNVNHPRATSSKALLNASLAIVFEWLVTFTKTLF